MSDPGIPDVPTGLGSYQIVRRLAVGGMAEVLLARQIVRTGIERMVVIKSILPGMAADADIVSMFLSEARVAAQLQHPNIVQIHDVTRIGDRPCIVMEYLKGLDARRLGQRVPELPIGVIAAIGEGAAHGLGYAHRAHGVDGRPLSVVHRDVSPHNIFVTSDGGVKVLDFGIAKSTAQLQQTQEGTLKGKIAYMSPEQLRGEPLDGRSDLFALGSVLWELAVGRPLFGRMSEIESFSAVIEGPIDPPSSLRPGISHAFDQTVLWALSRDRDARPATGEDFARALHAIAEAECDGLPVLATARIMGDLLDEERPSAPAGLPSLQPTKQGPAGTAPHLRQEDTVPSDVALAMTLSLVSAGSGSITSPKPAPAPAPATTVPPLAIGDLRLEGLEAPSREEELPTRPRGPKPVAVTAPDRNAPIEPDAAVSSEPLVLATEKAPEPSPYPAAPTPVVKPDLRDKFDPEGYDLAAEEKAKPKSPLPLAVDVDEELRAMGRPLRELERRATALAGFGKPPFALLTPLYCWKVVRRRAALARRVGELRAELPILEAEARDAQAAVGRAVFAGSRDRRIEREAGAVEVAVQGLESGQGDAKKKLDAELAVEERLAALGHAAVSRVAGASVPLPEEAKARAAARRLEEARAELEVTERAREMYDTGAFRSGIALSFVLVASVATLITAAVIVQ